MKKKVISFLLVVSLLCGICGFEVATANTPATATHGFNYFDYVFIYKKADPSISNHVEQYTYAISDNVSNIIGDACAYAECTSFGSSGSSGGPLVVSVYTQNPAFPYAANNAPAFFGVSSWPEELYYISGYVATYGDCVKFRGKLNGYSGLTEIYANCRVKG